MINTLRRKSTPPRVKRRALSIPVEFDCDPIICAAWLPYDYEESMTEDEVAHPLCMSRASIVNFPQETRDRNIANIVVSSQHLQTVDAALSGNTATMFVTNKAIAGVLVSRAVRFPGSGVSRRH
jgi:type IV secretory pathway VirB9-like protein